MKPSQACLTPEVLQQLVCDRLADSGLQSVEEHLNGCPRCRELLDLAESDEFWRQEIAPLLRSSPELRADGAIDFDHGGDQSLNAVLRLLGPTDDPRMLGRIGSYEVVGVIGRGGMGVVFKAFDGALNRYVAIKMLSPSLAEMGAARKRFAREGQAAAAVIDDHVMPIYSVAEWQGVPYLVMQYSRGSTLQKRVEDQGPLELKEILRIGMQTARGLAAAHASGLVHRDVKPSNILLDGTVERALLTDFGLARAVDDASITRTGMIAGTPQYMSPEQARGGNVDARSDLFSLGGVLYFMATGRQPFRADNSYATLRLIIDQEPKNMQEINPDLPVWLCTLISHLMAKGPENRPASAEEVAEVLQHCLAHVQQPAAVPLPDTTHWLTTEGPPQQTQRSSATRFVFAVLVALVAMIVYAGLGILNDDNLNSETNRALAKATPIAQQAPDITGLWIVKSGLAGQFSIRRLKDSLQAFEIHPLNGPPDLKWTVEWASDRKQFEGTAVIPGDITGSLELSITPGGGNSQLDVSLTFDDLQKRRLLRSLSDDGIETPSAELRMIEMLDLLRHQRWLRDDSATPSQPEPGARPEAGMPPVRPFERVDAFRAFDSDSVSEGASATWRKYVQWWNSTKGTPLEPSAEVPSLVWATPLVRLAPKYIYTHGANVVIVRSLDEDGEDGIYVVLGIASGHGPNDEQFTRTLIAHAPGGDVYTFRRKGSFKRTSQSVRTRTDGGTDADTRKAIDAGLDYLARNQQKDGSWVSGDHRGNVAITAVAGRAILAADDLPGRGPNGARITKAIEYILRNEDDGLLAEGTSASMSEHGQAVRFLADAYGEVTDKALKNRIKNALPRAVKLIADSQTRPGGWRYTPTTRDADLIETCCQLHALAAAKRAGFDVPQATVDNGIKYVLSCRDLVQGDKFCYTPTIPSVASAAFEYTAAAVSALNTVGYDGDKEPVERGTEFIRSFQSPGDVDAHFYEARCNAATVMKAGGGKDWDRWYSAVRDDLLKRQNNDGAWGGPANPSCFDTALALIILHSR